MRRIHIFGLLLSWLLAGCQAKGITIPSPAIMPGPTLPSETRVPATSTSPVAIPSATPSFTPFPPTHDLREYVVRTGKASVWDAPANENRYWNLQTELILGERVLVMEQQGEWAKIVAVEQPSSKDPLGYPGWVRVEALIQGWPQAEKSAVVMAPRSQLRVEPEGAIMLPVVLDTRLPVESEQGDWVQVRLPDGNTGWLPLSDVRLTDDLSQPLHTDEIFILAEQLAGIPYWWGGTTTDSLDCSGFIYRLFHAYGIPLSRDAGDLALSGGMVDREDLQKGDLIFTSDTRGEAISHVAMYWGNGMILDASGGRGVSKRPLAELLSVNSWITARRILP
jgi:cell wall-associated NlpC family hydrolase